MLASVLPSVSNVIEDNKLTLTGNVMADRPEGDSPRRGATAPGTNVSKLPLESSAPHSKTVAGKPPTDLLEPTAPQVSIRLRDKTRKETDTI